MRGFCEVCRAKLGLIELVQAICRPEEHTYRFDTATGRYRQHDYVTSAFGTLVEKRSPAMKGANSDHFKRWQPATTLSLRQPMAPNGASSSMTTTPPTF